MSNRYFYRAKPELAAALRAMRADRKKFWDTVIKPFQDEYPDNPPMWRRQQVCIGFGDGRPDQEPPAGLSRAKRRDHLIPVRTKPGDVWRDCMGRLNQLPSPERVLREFNVPTEVFGPGHLYFTSWMDLDEDSATPDGPNVVIYLGYEFSPVPDAVELLKRSEFYTLHEAAMERKAAAEGSEDTRAVLDD